MVDFLRPQDGASPPAPRAYTVRLVVSWLWVGIPLICGVWETINQSRALFR